MARTTYKVRKGDSYFRIAERLWGNQLFAGQLIKANPGINKLFPGIVLRLPKVDVNDPEPWFGQAAWGRAGEMETKRQDQRRKEQQKAKIQRQRDKRLPQGWTIPGDEPELVEKGPIWERTAKQEELPDWFLALPDEDFGSFSREEVWEAAQETAALIKKLGLVPGEAKRVSGGKVRAKLVLQGETPDADEPDYEESPEAMKDWEKIKEVFGSEEEVEPTEAPTGTPTTTTEGGEPSDVRNIPEDVEVPHTKKPDEVDKGLAVLEEWRKENLELAGEDIRLKGRVSETYYRVRDMYLRGVLDLAEIGTKYGMSGTADEWQQGGVSTQPYNEDLVGDYIVLYWSEIPEEGGLFYLPESSIVSHSGFGNGYTDWTSYYQLPGEGVDPSEEHDAAQYIAPGRVVSEEQRQEILDETKDDIIMSTHYNLCGQLAMIAAMEFDLSEGLVEFALMGLYGDDQNAYASVDAYEGYDISRGIDILNHPDVTTTIETINRFANTLAGDDYDVTLHTDQLNHVETSDELSEMLDNGDRLVVLVNIDTGEEGKLKAIDQVEGDGSTPHWVSVQDIITTHDGSQLVRVYNPYKNREEVYDWNMFAAAWGSTEGNNRENVVIQISSADSEQNPQPEPEVGQGEGPPRVQENVQMPEDLGDVPVPEGLGEGPLPDGLPGIP